LENLLEALYASLVVPERFQDFVVGLRHELDAHLIALQSDDSQHQHRVESHFDDIHAVPDVSRLADDARVNQFLLRGAQGFLSNGVFCSSGLFAPGELERTAFYEDVLRQVDVFHTLGFLLWSDASGNLVGMSASRDRRRGQFGEEQLALGRRLLPHLRNVYTLQRRVQSLECMAETLEQRCEAMLLVDGAGHIVHATVAAELLLGSKRGVFRSGQGLGCAWRADGVAWREALAATSGPSPRQVDFLLHEQGGQPWAVCHVHPLHSATFRLWALPHAPRAAALIVPLSSGAIPAPGTLRDIFGLTHAEAQLAEALLKYGSLAACRAPLGKSHETLRSQLRGLFQKTGTNRQPELVQRLRSAC
jgi:hypothetical protein